jgi:nuclear GTP-binding protein
MARRNNLQSPAMEVADSPEAVEDMDVEGDEAESSANHTYNLGQNSRRAYLRELRKVVESADVILHVLDARDPLGTKSKAIEDMVLSNSRRRLVYVLNKADLVPKEVLTGWLAYLRKFHPTIPFKCNTQTQSTNLGRISGKVSKQQESALQTSQAVGAEELIGLLKNYSRLGDMKSIIGVGVVGFPNVGKSSLLNSLLRIRAVGVSSTPGFTKQSQEVILDKNIRLIDSPGVVFADGDSAATALRNCVNVEELEDVITPIQAILDRCPQPYLMQLYAIPKFKNHDVMAFLALVSKATGRLKKGGIPNTDAAARGVLHDWNTGKIKYYCKPPVIAADTNAAAIVDEFSPTFDLEDQGRDISVLDAIEAQKSGNQAYIAMDAVAENIDIHIGNFESERSSKKTENSLTSRMIKSGGSSMDEDTATRDEDRRSNYTSSTSRRTSSDQRLESFIDESTIGKDARKLQKQSKKKAAKAMNRELRRASVDSNSADYSFEDDFQYE